MNGVKCSFQKFQIRKLPVLPFCLTSSRTDTSADKHSELNRVTTAQESEETHDTLDICYYTPRIPASDAAEIDTCDVMLR